MIPRDAPHPTLVRGRHGRYALVRKVATGGMAELWLAEVVGKPGHTVAVKRVLQQHAERADFEQMFLDEMRIASLLHHPNIVETLDVGAVDDGFFLAMPYLDGVNLRAVLKRSARDGVGITLGQGLAVALGVARGLQYAHERVDDEGQSLGIVHRDVSPANVFLTRTGEVKLLDFGIARATSRSTHTRSGTLKGKIPYMSPEQCLGESVDRRSDVYALGALMFELTTGRRWVQPAADFAMLSQIVSDVFEPPRSVVPGYPADLESIVLKCLARRRTRRFQSIGLLLAELERFVSRNGLDVSPAAVADLVRMRFGDANDDAGSSVSGSPAGDAEPTGPSLSPAAEAPADPPGITAPPDPLSVELPPDTSAPPLPRAKPMIEVATRGAYTVVSIRGRLTEQFSGEAVAAHLRGSVVLDLERVERVTSFGVREWLGMMAAVAPGCRLWLARCSEPIVNQLTLIRHFEGPGRVVSFVAPYLCPSCAAVFLAPLDVWRHRAALLAASPPPVPCPQCGVDAHYDDDPSAFAALAEAVDPDPPADLQDVVDPSARPQGARVDKRVEGRSTRIVFTGPLGPSVRWRPAFDGVEGDVILDLGGSVEVAAGGIAPLVSALRDAAPGTERLTVLGAPVPLARALEDARIPSVALTSIVVEAACPSCGVPRRAAVPIEGTVRDSGAKAACPVCGGELWPRSSASSGSAPVRTRRAETRRWLRPEVAAAVAVGLAVSALAVASGIAAVLLFARW